METSELLKRSKPELTTALANERESLRKLKFDLIAGKVKNIRAIRESRKLIARILTVLNTKKHG